ncbi:MAG: hypothetical protein M3291_10495 [Actinomycetota bacterium]|nr:hypothetical protein [Actinomycetota bacterium]
MAADNFVAMPSSLHEALIEMFRQRPSLAAELLADALGMDLPAYEQVRVEPGGFTDLVPTEYRADAVVVLTAAETPVLAVVLEVQLGRDQDKRWSWPIYLVTLRGRLRCPTVLLVVCVDTATATWCATPIELGHPGARLTPLVLGPDQVPLVIDRGEAVRVPELAVLSAMAHGAHSDRSRVLDTLLGALEAIDEDLALLYSDVVLAALPVAAQQHLEALMITRTYEYQSDFARRHRAQGEAKGKAEATAAAVLAVLDARGVEVPEDVRARITECLDLDQLDTWVRRAGTADSVHDLFV